jgi:hypothetical protein
MIKEKTMSIWEIRYDWGMDEGNSCYFFGGSLSNSMIWILILSYPVTMRTYLQAIQGAICYCLIGNWLLSTNRSERYRTVFGSMPASWDLPKRVWIYPLVI